LKIPVVPFLTPPEGTVLHGDWRLRTSDGDVELPRELPHWDYKTKMAVSAPLFIDRTAATESCGLERNSGLAVLVLASSNHTRVEERVALVPCALIDDVELEVECLLDGALLGGRLTLETQLVVTDPRPTNRLAAQHPGSILWKSRRWTDLEGSGTQFPTEAIPFGAAGLDPGAGWHLKIDTADPDARFAAAVRLTLNSDQPAIRLIQEGARDAATQRLLRTLHWDITRQMVQVALATDEVVDLEVDFEGSSVSQVLRNLLGRLWPSHSPETLRQWAANDPSRIEVPIQHLSGLLK
jgi:hypothetical protein